ncbi:MAG TPA: T9SS type A sorting domain-containing protein, partial [Candidatus Kapabacteria bacterium]|nr:T9SS type A sorting domain-containing protein [Candidatus Kapabacteria bacterium]
GLGNGPELDRFVPTGTPSTYWDGADSGIDFTQGMITSFTSLGGYFFAGATGGAAYRSTDNGLHWILNAGGYVCSNGADVFCVSDGIYRSEDSGNTNSWIKITNLTATDLAAIATYIFAKTSSGIWRSKNSGTDWGQIFPPFSGTMTVMDSLLFIVGNDSLAESTDSGTHWFNVSVDSGGTVPETVNVLVTDGKNLFAGTTNGVYVSTDIGKSWEAENDGLGNLLDVDALGVFDTLLFVNVPAWSPTFYTAMRPISEMTAKSAVQPLTPATSGIAVYPNPMTNSGTITYSIAEQTRVNVTIFDVLGRTVTIPVASESKEAGTYSVDFDARAIPSGLYWCQLSTASETKLVKLIIGR